MKKGKRIAVIVLALILCVSIVQQATPLASAAQNGAYRWILSFVKEYGQYDADANQYAIWWDSPRYDEMFWIIYDASESDLYLMLSYSTSYVYMVINTENFTYVDVYAGTIDMYEGRARIHCPEYDAEDEIKLVSFSGDTAYSRQATNQVYYGVPIILEQINNLLVLSGSGYTVQAFGFPSFSWHNNHVYDDGVVIQESTCVVLGIIRYTCLVCGETKEEDLPRADHDWKLYRYDKYPTCTEDGIACYSCAVCKVAKNEVAPALGHNWTITEVLTEAEESHACTGLYTCARCGDTKEAALCAAEVFTDMPAEGHWAHNAIDWAYFHGLTAGTTPTTFSPDKTVTRAEVVTFLWAAFGKPASETAGNSFADVSERDWYYQAVLWALENGITKGVSEGLFGPGKTCSRSQIVTFLWAAAGKPAPQTTENPFTDVSEGGWYYMAVLWAVENGITKGVGEGRFGPEVECTRAQLVTFLYKAYPILTAAPAPEPKSEPCT